MTCLRSPPTSTHSDPGLIMWAEGRLRIQLLAELVEVRDPEVGAPSHAPLIGLQLAQDQANESCPSAPGTS